MGEVIVTSGPAAGLDPVVRLMVPFTGVQTCELAHAIVGPVPAPDPAPSVAACPPAIPPLTTNENGPVDPVLAIVSVSAPFAPATQEGVAEIVSVAELVPVQ